MTVYFTEEVIQAKHSDEKISPLIDGWSLVVFSWLVPLLHKLDSYIEVRTGKNAEMIV